jgi:hypothetical protein
MPRERCKRSEAMAEKKDSDVSNLATTEPDNKIYVDAAEEYFNDLTEANWPVISQCMIDARKPRLVVDNTKGGAPTPDHAMIRSHIEMIHALAESSSVDGILTLTRIEDKGKIHTERFSIGDVDSHANAVIGWSANQGVNLYAPWAIFRKDFPRGSKGDEEHVVAVLAFVGDLDADTGKAGAGLDGLPVASPYVIETSTGNYQPVFPLAQALSRTQAKPIAVGLSDTIGADSRTKDTSGLWRIPGTLNWPSAKKLGRGRSAIPQLVKVQTAWTGELVNAETVQAAIKPKAIVDAAKVDSKDIDWSVVDKHAGWLKGVESLPESFSKKGRIIVAHSGKIADLNFDLKDAGIEASYTSWSEVSMAFAAVLKHHGSFSNEQIAAALMSPLDCNQHVTKLPDHQKRRAVERSILRSHEPAQSMTVRNEGEPEWRERLANLKPRPSMHNARLAITALGIVCSHDLFHNKTLFGYRDDKVKHELASIVGEVSDDGIIALRQLMSDRFGFDMEDKATRDAVKSLALDHRFDPVVDLIDKAQAEWDGVKRLDRMAADYFNCEDTPLNAAFMRKTMIGMVARARHPGCKFDTIPVLESKEGFNKSTAWRVLAGDDNFSDEPIIGKGSREVQEQLSEIWVHENADLAGMKKAEVETVKAYASRMQDVARPAFGHFVRKQPRHSIEVGSTNTSEYLQSQTGNRRFWPMVVTKWIDAEKLSKARLQLIGEAATYEAGGESMVLDEALWADAGVEQEQRRMKDPWEDKLEHLPKWWDTITGYDADHRPIKGVVKVIHLADDNQEFVAAETILKHVLEIQIGHQTTAIGMRLSTVMKQIGWLRHKNGYVSIPGYGRVKGYYRYLSEDDAYAERALELQGENVRGLSDHGDLKVDHA